ncbi:hypothetical protein DMN91_012880 [Ooceraea biroi]|uniref:CHK kinase-like domain-containing protein n=1 Tax=Ooceraea biroi TaxID=2015173 RepID=A0A3L8D4Q7_OOCBI|nr:hypothetical protein DMN91_012880 [Ooceraea biroi]
MVGNWFKNFRDGDFSLANEPRGRPKTKILMLEDLSLQGFVMKGSKILDYPHVSLALRCLGELHAYSFVIRAANPEMFEKFQRMQEPLVDENFYNNNAFRSKELAKVVIKALADEDEHYVKRVQQFADNVKDNMCSAVDGTLAEPYAVVNHGDAWTNNILFKYDKETRSKYYDQLIHEYYETLSKYLRKCGYDPDILFPYEALSQQFIKFGKFAAGMALYVLHLFSIEDADIGIMNDNTVLFERLQTDSFYRSMVKGTFKDLVDRNYL